MKVATYRGQDLGDSGNQEPIKTLENGAGEHISGWRTQLSA